MRMISDAGLFCSMKITQKIHLSQIEWFSKNKYGNNPVGVITASLELSCIRILKKKNTEQNQNGLEL